MATKMKGSLKRVGNKKVKKQFGKSSDLAGKGGATGSTKGTGSTGARGRVGKHFTKGEEKKKRLRKHS